MRRHSLLSHASVPTVIATIMGSAFLPPTARATCPSADLFAPAVFYGVGVYAVSVAAGDYNSDGATDLAVTNLNDNTVSILLGRDDGTFQNQTTYATGLQPRGLAAVDVDGDAILDLVVTDVGPATICVLRGLGLAGHGNGTFAAPASYAAGYQNRGIAVNDLNGDGHPDVVVAGRTSVAVLVNQFAGGAWGKFPTATLYPTSSSWGVAVADFDGDGKLDVAAGNWLEPNVNLFLGNGDGTFHPGTTVTTPGGCADITTGDLNGDGIPDLVAAGSSGIWVMRGNGSGGHGDGTFAVAAFAQMGHQFNSAIIGDFNGDGIADIIGTDTDGTQAVFLPGNGSGGFGALATFPVGTGPIGLVSFDANHDLAPDLFVVCSASLGYPGSIAALIGQCLPPDPPHITRVMDVPNDQGGRVFVLWLRSRGDNPFDFKITGYRVWRRDVALVPTARVAPDLATFDPRRHAAAMRRILAPSGVEVVTYWELLATVPAAFLDGYAYTAATTQDSMPHSNPFTAFFVQALTAEPFTFYNSPVDSGYSVDNMPPRKPDDFSLLFAPGATHLHWIPNTELDLAGYRLYRGSSIDFQPDPANLIAAKTDTGFVDPAGALFYYKLSAVDTHGNESEYARMPQGTLDVPDVGPSSEVWLGPATPNPAKSGAQFKFSLPRDSRVTLILFDQQGRKVRELAGGVISAGEHAVAWDGRDGSGRRVPSGLYFCRLEVEGRALIRRLAAIH